MHSPDYAQWSIPAEGLEAIAAAFGGAWEVRSLQVPQRAAGDGAREAPTELLEAIRDAEVYFGFGIPRDALQAATRLRWIHSGAAGARSSLFPEMLRSDVVFTNSAGIHAEPLAETALGMMLYFARGFDVCNGGRSSREWRFSRIAAAGTSLAELSGASLGVIGYGGIGRAVGVRAHALGMVVRGLRRRPGRSPCPEVTDMFGPRDLSQLLAASDYVILALPETPETSGLIGAAEIAGMRRGGVLINLARGGIVEEAALIDALASGRLRGAGLDVFQTEPLPPESPLWEMENVLITPHVGALSSRFWQREIALIVRNVGDYLSGEPMRNVVDKERGY